MKKLIFVICFFLLTSVLTINSEGNYKDKSSKELSLNKISHKFDYTYVWVLREGVWWILVYDEDGKLVNEYPAE